jgi:hypothetical protein
VTRFVTLPCPRGDGGHILLGLVPAPEGVPACPEPGWHVCIWEDPGPRGGTTRRRHCDVGHALVAREVDRVCVLACEVYEAYREAGGGLPA